MSLTTRINNLEKAANGPQGGICTHPTPLLERYEDDPPVEHPSCDKCTDTRAVLTIIYTGKRPVEEGGQSHEPTVTS